MTTQIPDLGEEISFCVDGGTQAGPFPMRQIIDSVRSGERPQNVLVWWAGEAEWLPFDANTTLMTLMAELPPLQTEAAPSEPASVLADVPARQAIEEPAAVQPEPDVFEPSFPVIADSAPTVSDTEPTISDPQDIGLTEAVDAVDPSATSADEVEEVHQVEDPVDGSPLSEVFGALALASHTQDGPDVAETSVAPELMESDSESEPSTLRQLEDRVDALTVDEDVDAIAEDVSEVSEVAESEIADETVHGAPVPQHNFDADELAAHFDSLVSASRMRRVETAWTYGVDQVFSSGIVSAFSDAGFHFLDAAESDEGQTLRFDNPIEGSQVVVGLGAVQSVDDSGRADVDVSLAWGQHVQNAHETLASFGAEQDELAKGSEEIRFDADDLSSRAFAKVDLVVDAHGYVNQDLQADGEAISLMMMSAVQALKGAWLGRFEAATV